jgi:hypothetical protein
VEAKELRLRGDIELVLVASEIEEAWGRSFAKVLE